jgi:hypothetical protein
VWLGQDDPLEVILPPAGELIWGTVAFALAALVVIVAVVLIVRVVTGEPSADPGEGRDELLERALRAEAERDLLRDQLEALRGERADTSDPG